MPTPLVLAGRPARQVDPTSCGAAVLVVSRALTDPDLRERLAAQPGLFADLQGDVRVATARAALGPLPWPRALGTPPWTAGRELGFRAWWLGPGDRASGRLERALADIHALTEAGVAVPLYSGHELLARSPWAARRAAEALGRIAPFVPRHVVLALPAGRPLPGGGIVRARTSAGAPLLHVYEPGGGEVHRVRPGDLLAAGVPATACGPAGADDPVAAAAGRRGRFALGCWPQVCAVLRPA